MNEAWEPVEVSDALPKKDYAIKQKVDGPAKDTAGKYSKNKKKSVRPGFGKVTTTFN